MDNNSLRRQLSPMHVWAIAFGCVIGWGSFINPGKKFLPNSGVAGTTIAMILGALVMIIIAFSYAYMVPKYPNAGGEFSFAKNTFGKHMHVWKTHGISLRLVSGCGLPDQCADEFDGNRPYCGWTGRIS